MANYIFSPIASVNIQSKSADVEVYENRPINLSKTISYHPSENKANMYRPNIYVIRFVFSKNGKHINSIDWFFITEEDRNTALAQVDAIARRTTSKPNKI